jgi:CDP-diacylglycerol---serine O-phosphatidyltransferase
MLNKFHNSCSEQDLNKSVSLDYHKKRGVYLVPNLITTAGLFAGFYAIVAAMKAHFEPAAIALFIAVVMDSLDGRVARLTGTQSAFGAQYDSLSDMVCFGVTPALVVYNWGLQYLGKVGWLVAFMYVAATGLRLARFNLSDNPCKKFFIGLPCTSAAAVIAGIIWVGTDFGIPGKRISELVALVIISLSLLMVSNLPYHSFKDLDLKGNVPFISIFLVVFVYSLVAWDPPKILFSIFFLYALSGIILFFRHKYLTKHTINKKDHGKNQAKISKIK